MTRGDSRREDEYTRFGSILTSLLGAVLPGEWCTEVVASLAETLTHATLRLQPSELELSLSELESHRLTQCLREQSAPYMMEHEAGFAWSFLANQVLELFFTPHSPVSKRGDGSEKTSKMKGCDLCGRQMPLTLHHLVPRSTHAYFLAHPPPNLPCDVTKQALSTYVAHVCRPCHSHIHLLIPDHKELGREYHSLDQLRARDDVMRWIAYIRKQRVTDVAMGNKVRYRR